MRILHVIDTSFVGGGQTAVRHILEGFRDQQVATELACREGGPLMEQARELGTAVHHVPFDKRYLPDRAWRVARLVLSRGINVMHSHGLLATYYCTMARAMFGAKVPLVYHQHGFHHHNHGSLTRGMRMRAERWICGRADKIIAVSRSDQRQLIQEGYAPASRVSLIHYGLPDRSAPDEKIAAVRTAIGAAGRPVVGLVARLHPQKGVDTFLRAAARVKQQIPSTRFAIVGVGELEGELRTLASTLGFNGELTWLTNQTPGVAAMPAFTVSVLSSRWEGLPLVLLEYMAAQRPIVATRVEGCLDAVGPQEAELVAADDEQAMAQAILRLLTDRGLAERRAAAARARFDQGFTLQAMTAKIRKVYDEVMA